MVIPTVMKNTPISNPLNGAISISIWWRYSVFGQQETRKKGAERGREPRGAGGGGDPHHHEQRDRHDEIATAGLGGKAEDRLQHVTTSREDGGDGKHGLQQSPCQRHRDMLLVAREELHAEQDRRHHQILEQQHRERDAADRRRRTPLLLEQLHHDRGRGHREAEAEHDRAVAGHAQHCETRADRKCRQRELQAADAGNVATQRPEPCQRQFQPDQEQEKQHPQFAERFDPLAVIDGQITKPRNVLGEPAKAVRADHDADTEKDQHGPDARAVKQRNHKPGSR
jgi:hypothetical protein